MTQNCFLFPEMLWLKVLVPLAFGYVLEASGKNLVMPASQSLYGLMDVVDKND